MSKHTPGPWKIHEHGVGFEVECANGNVVAQAQQVTALRQDTMQSARKANARLIAAAPELLEALSKFVEFAELHGEVVFSGGGMSAIDAMNACTSEARAAIAKAKGEKP